MIYTYDTEKIAKMISPKLLTYSKENGRTPLMYTATLGGQANFNKNLSEKIQKLFTTLVQCVTDINIKDERGNTIPMLACGNPHLSVVHSGILERADLQILETNVAGYDLLSTTVLTNDLYTTEELLKELSKRKLLEVALDRRMKEGKTLLILAGENGYREMAALLIRFGAKDARSGR